MPSIIVWLSLHVAMIVLSGPVMAHADIVTSPSIIMAKHSGKCIDVYNGSVDDGAQMMQERCDRRDTQQFTLVSVGDTYQIVGKLSGKCLTVSGASIDNGAPVLQSGCTGGDNQLWYVRLRGDHFQLVAKHSKKCIEVPGGNKNMGIQLVQWPCHGGANQAWAIASLPHTTVQAKHSQQCIEVLGGSIENGVAVIQGLCHGGNNQQLTLMPYQDAYYLIAKHSGKCLSANGVPADGSPIVQWPCQGRASQLWYPRASGRHYTLVSKHSGKCLNVRNGSQVSGEALVQFSCSLGDHQLWQIDMVSTTGGKWSEVIPISLVPSAAATLPNGKLLLWSSKYRLSFSNGGGQTYTSIFDPETKQATERLVVETGHDMFCPGTSNLPDGRILINGGNNSKLTSIYNAETDSWARGQPMGIGRGYEANTVLPNGDVFTLGGSWSGGRGGKDGEVWNATTGWRRTPGIPASVILTNDLKGVYRSDNHAWLFTVGENQVFHAGPSKQMNWMTTESSGTITFAGIRGNDEDSMNGNAVMYDVGKILKVGGALNYDRSPATTSAYVIDLTNGVTVNQVASMAYARSFSNSVVLPNGEVIVFGGQSYPIPFDDLETVLAPELWNPVTKTFTTLVAMHVPRNYHGVALLMPDGRVFVGGGGLCETCITGNNHTDAQIFTPPYLLNADGSDAIRPMITQAPINAGHGTTIMVGTDSPVSQFALVRLSSVTHSVNNDQRRIPLTFTIADANAYSLSIPSDRGIVLPGYYMLFGINSSGVPSVAKIIKIG